MVDAQEFARDRYGERASVPEPLGAGGWSKAYSLELDGRAVVLRFGQYGDDFAKDAAIGSMSLPDLPVPRVLEYGPTGDGFFAVSERCYGTALDALTGPEMEATLPSLKATLEAIASVEVLSPPCANSSRDDEVSWPEGLLHLDSERPRLGGWRAKLAASPVGTGSFGAGMAAMREMVATIPDARQLIHNDLLAGNVLVKHAAITGLFDWGNAMIGDALYETAILRFWWPWFPQWSGIDIATELAVPESEDRLLAYELHIGLDHLQYNAWVGKTEELIRTDAQVRALLG